MSEKPKSYESAPQYRLFQVVGVPAHDGIRRSIVVQFFDNPKFIGTAQILNEGTEDERLAFAGTSGTETLHPTDEIWDRSRAVDGMIATFGKDTAGIKDLVENLFPQT